MKPGEIVYQGKSKKGTEMIIRYPLKTDAPEMMRYINTLSCEYSFILFQGEQVTLKEETKHLHNELLQMKNGRKVVLLAFHDGVLIGNTSVTLKEKAEKHVGGFGISIAKEFRGEGIGKLLMDLVFAEAKKHLSDLKVYTLGVFEDNDLALSIYKKFGFVEYGRLPKGLRHKDAYVDHIFMYKNV